MSQSNQALKKKMFTYGLLLFCLFAATLRSAAASNAVTSMAILYDGALGGLPNSQQMQYLALGSPFPTPAQATHSAVGGVTTLDTTSAMGDKAGYYDLGVNVPTLDRTQGFRVQFTTQILSENHATADRAGWSLIVLGSDKKGIELGFWEDKIWAQNDSPLFTHGEEVAFDTTAGLTNYTLDVLGNVYTLTTGTTTLLTGTVRDYSAAAGSFSFVYNTANLVFIGDNTSSAETSAKLSFVSVTQGIPVTIPTSVLVSNITVQTPPSNTVAVWIGLLAMTLTAVAIDRTTRPKKLR